MPLLHFLDTGLAAYLLKWGNSEALEKRAIKNFRVLEPVTRSDTFNDLESLKIEIGTGSVICMSNDLLPIDEKNWYVPAWLI